MKKPKTKRVAVWMPEGQTKKGLSIKVCPNVPLPPEGKPNRIWTMYAFCSSAISPPLTMELNHLDGAFLEDSMHEWHVNPISNELVYRSRAFDGGCWLMFEYD